MALHDDSSWMEPGTVPFEWEVRPGVPKYSTHLDENSIEQEQEQQPAAADDDHQSLKVSAFELGTPPPSVTLSSTNTEKTPLFVPPGPIFRHSWTKGSTDRSNKKSTTAGQLKSDYQNQHVGSAALSSSSSTPLLFTSSSSPSSSSASPSTVNTCKPADRSVRVPEGPIFRQSWSSEGSTGHKKKQKLDQWKPESASPSSSSPSPSPSTADDGRKTAGKSVLVPGPMFRHSWAKRSTRC